jgi:hypothetical protein
LKYSVETQKEWSSFFCLLVGAKNGAEGIDLDFGISIK